VVPIDEDCAKCSGVGAGFFVRPRESSVIDLKLTPGKVQMFEKCVSIFDIECPFADSGEA